VTSRRIHVLSVLFGQTEDEIARLLRALAIALEKASSANLVQGGSVLLGNCGAPYRSDLVAELQQILPTVQLIEFGENLGHSAGCNALAAQSGAEPLDILFFLNPDTVPAPIALPPLIADLAKSDVGAVDSRQIPFEHPKFFDPETREQSWASGAALAVRSEVFEKVGGFDPEHFWSYCNDVDLSWRIRLQGWKILSTPDSVVFHDKRIDKDGGVQPTASEVRFSTLGRLNLARRYGRPDIERETLAWIDTHGSVAQRQVALEFCAASENGRAPTPVDGSSEVAEFTKGEYGERRF
jgi:hypothetical protein